MAKMRAKVHTQKAKAIAGDGVPNTPEETAVHPELRNEQATAALAYEFWIQRGCPIGTPEEDWFRAEEELKNHHKALTATAGGGQ